MPKANANHIPSRRNFLGHLAGGAAVATVVASTAHIARAVPAGNPDAELISLCAEFDALELRGLALYQIYNSKVQDPPDALLWPIRDEQDELLKCIVQKRATTDAAFRALANTIVLASPELMDDNMGGFMDGVLRMLLRDLTANSLTDGAA
jgi:hypothetical protein